MIVLLFLLVFVELSQAYTSQARFGHSAVPVNDSIYFYGGDSSVSSSSEVNQWISGLSILPIHSQYPLTYPPWKPASGPQDSVGGPFVYLHVAFLGGTNNGNTIVIGSTNSFSLPRSNHLNRQGAAYTTVEHGVAYVTTIKARFISVGRNSSEKSKKGSTALIDEYRLNGLYKQLYFRSEYCS